MPDALPDDQCLSDTVYLESGHATVGRALSLPLGTVSADHTPDAGPDNLGALIFADRIRLENSRSQLECLFLAIAGPMTEARVNKCPKYPHGFSRWYVDDDDGEFDS